MTKRESSTSIITAMGKALRDAKAPWVVLAIIALALILAACAVDTRKLERTRADMVTLCQGALTTPLKLACERAGIATEPVEPAPM